MDTAQRDALADWNATRPRKQPTPMQDAELAHRVALATAHEEYEKALAKAAQDLVRAADRADRALAAARARQDADDRQRANLSAYYRDRAEGLLREDLARFRYMLSPQYGVHRDRTLDSQVQLHIDLISAALARRGVDVS